MEKPINYVELVRQYRKLHAEAHRIADIITTEIKSIDREAKLFEFSKCTDIKFEYTGAIFYTCIAEYNHIDRDAIYTSWTAIIPSEYFYSSTAKIRQLARKEYENNTHGWLDIRTIKTST